MRFSTKQERVLERRTPSSQIRPQHFKVWHELVASFSNVTDHPHCCQLGLKLNYTTIYWCIFSIQSLMFWWIDSRMKQDQTGIFSNRKISPGNNRQPRKAPPLPPPHNFSAPHHQFWQEDVFKTNICNRGLTWKCFKLWSKAGHRNISKRWLTWDVLWQLHAG